MHTMNIRKASIQDIAVLTKLRIDFLKTLKGLPEKKEEIIKAQLYSYFEKHLNKGDFIALLAEEDGKIISTAFLVIHEFPANVSFITGITATLINVFTYPEFRRQGIAMHVIKKLIEEAKKLHVSTIDLSSTEVGRELYKKLHFEVSEYIPMRLIL